MDADTSIKLEPDYEYLEISSFNLEQQAPRITRGRRRTKDADRKHEVPIEFCDVDLLDEDLKKVVKMQYKEEEFKKQDVNDDSEDEWTPLSPKSEYVSKSIEKKCKSKRGDTMFVPPDPLLCYMCDKTYSSKFILDRHILIHKIELRRRKLHICPYCSKMFNRYHDLKVHVWKHTGESPFSCDICNKKFRSKTNLEEHAVVHTGVKPYTCDACGRGFKVRSSLKMHWDFNHSDKVMTLTCEVCSKAFKSKRALRNHMITHSGVKNHQCHLCEKRFSTRQTLKIHLVIHTGERPHSCEICSQSFRQRSALQGHMLTHLDVKPKFECTVCNKKFKRRPTLNRHMNVHTGEKPYVCTVCGRCFSQKGNLIVHMRYHNGGQPHACPICHKRYSHSSKVASHIRKHHDAGSKRMAKTQKSHILQTINSENM